MYETIFKVIVRNEDDDVINSYLYTDYSAAKSDAQKMADNRKKNAGIGFFTQTISHEFEDPTVVIHFDDHVTITVRESGWAENENKTIRLCSEVDYTGTVHYKYFPDETAFMKYIRLNQPKFAV